MTIHDSCRYSGTARRAKVRMAAWGMTLLALPLPALCRTSAPPSLPDTTVIGGQAFSNGRGIAAINQAAGFGNMQANSDAISTGPSHATVTQSNVRPPLPSVAGGALILGHAFAGFAGIVNLNQASGNNNSEANMVTIDRNWTPLTAAQLGAVSLPIHRTAAPPAGSAQSGQILDGPAVFAGARGVVQATQVVGTGNQVANSLAMNVPAGMAPAH